MRMSLSTTMKQSRKSNAGASSHKTNRLHGEASFFRNSKSLS